MMPRIPHGATLPLEPFTSGGKNLREAGTVSPSDAVACPDPTPFNYLFPELQKDSENLLKEAPITVANLIRLAATMLDDGNEAPSLDSNIPSAYGYFAQFVDHDITLEAAPEHPALGLDLATLSPDEIKQIMNVRSAGLDLDSVYGPGVDQNGCYAVPRVGDLMLIERAIPSAPHLPPTVDTNNSDLPREPGGNHPAIIGDRRNDTHLIISQLHLAFLRAHNELVRRGNSFEKARQLLRRHYQWLVVKDLLGHVADDGIVAGVLSGAINIFDPPDDDLYVPLEFNLAAYRFGHSMVRNAYNYNAIFENALKARLYQLLLPGPLAQGYLRILESWIIQWDRFIAGGSNLARRIDTRLVEPLASLPGVPGNSIKFSLAVRDLLRGYVMRLPTGQAVARALGRVPLTAQEIENIGAQVSPEQRQVLSESPTNFSSRTPLWFYVLAEAANNPAGRLGPVGSTLVAAVLIGLVRRSKDSYMRTQNWSPTLGQPTGQFNLPDLFRLAGVLP